MQTQKVTEGATIVVHVTLRFAAWVSAHKPGTKCAFCFAEYGKDNNPTLQVTAHTTHETSAFCTLRYFHC